MLLEDFYKADADADAEADADAIADTDTDADADTDADCLVESSTSMLLEMMMLDDSHVICIT